MLVIFIIPLTRLSSLSQRISVTMYCCRVFSRWQAIWKAGRRGEDSGDDDERTRVEEGSEL